MMHMPPTANYDKWKRGLMSGIGGTIVDKPMVRKEKDELAGKFRFGKTILITDLNYRCQSNSRGTTNIQYGLDEMGLCRHGHRHQQLQERDQSPEVPRCSRAPDQGRDARHCGRGECDHPFLDIICIPHHRHSSISRLS